ncbi:MAG: HNH endonuclease [Methylococcaceae bacterium]|nr:HNH endonuclease [Methylococcaceae bacterium]
MNPYQRALIEKVGVDNGFEHTLAADERAVTLASARHPARFTISLVGGGFAVCINAGSAALLPELRRSFPQAARDQVKFEMGSEAGLALLLRRAAGLSRALPNQAATSYQQALAEELAALPPGLSGTEVERMVRQRVGQQKFREAMLDYWGGACAVTGVAIPEVLRASHTKPWSECESDAERLDVYNGFLLTANLDALFDRFLISIDEQGRLVASPSLAEADLKRLGIVPGMRLRWLAAEHQRYRSFHHSRFLLSRSAARDRTVE